MRGDERGERGEEGAMLAAIGAAQRRVLRTAYVMAGVPDRKNRDAKSAETPPFKTGESKRTRERKKQCLLR